MLRVENLTVDYGAIVAVDQLSLSVAAGQAVTLLGANGAGKSSTLRAIGGLRRPRGGEIWLDGQRVDGWDTARLTRHGMSLVTDTRDIFPRMSVADNLRLGAISLRGTAFSARQAEVLALFPALERLLPRQAWMLSGGEQQMLALARALLAQPRLLLLDEPSLGLAPLIVKAIFAALEQIIAAGTALLLVEQTTVAALNLASYAYILRNGRVALEGTTESLTCDPRVLDLYLGGATTGA